MRPKKQGDDHVNYDPIYILNIKKIDNRSDIIRQGFYEGSALFYTEKQVENCHKNGNHQRTMCEK